jgi:hypothetical protein
VVRWLVERDAAYERRGLFAKNHAGAGPVHVAAAQGHVNVLGYLCGRAIDRALHAAVDRAAEGMGGGGGVDGMGGGVGGLGHAEVAYPEVAKLMAARDLFGEDAVSSACKGRHWGAALLVLRFGGPPRSAPLDARPALAATITHCVARSDALAHLLDGGHGVGWNPADDGGRPPPKPQRARRRLALFQSAFVEATARVLLCAFLGFPEDPFQFAFLKSAADVIG